jgi:alpha-glucosidase
LLHLPVAPWAQAGPDGLAVTLLLNHEAAPGSVWLRTLPDNEEVLSPLQPDGREGALWRWCGSVAWDHGNPATRYAFVIADRTGQRWLAADGEHPLVPPEALHFRHHRHETPPAWVREQVFYQVFPDRFASSGRPLPAGLRSAPWGTPPARAHAAHTHYGGDLPGLSSKLPYLHEELGITAIYLNPVFAAGSNHRYDTHDYDRVCPNLGGDEALLALREATHACGMRLVLDAVVNHTGRGHPWLSTSPERYAHGPDGSVLGWKGHASLPVLDFADPGLQQAVYGAADSVLRRWLEPPWSMDGWRLDVIHMLGEGAGAWNNAEHVRKMRRAIRSARADAYVLGEHFAEATRWLQGDQEDGAMNYYGFALPVQSWLAGLRLGLAGADAQNGPQGRPRLATADLVATLARAMAPIPYANQLAQFNLLDSHDTPRLLSELGGATPAALALQALAFTLLLSWPGVPCIYYGDEIGLEGGADPDNRCCFDWDRSRWQQPLWAAVQRLIALRKARVEWRAGGLVQLAHGEHWFAYARCAAGAATVVIANRGEAIEVDLPLAERLPIAPTHWQREGSTTTIEAAARVRLALPARSATLLLSP